MKSGQTKYRLLIENLPDAFDYHKIITISAGNPIDYIILDVNRNFEEMFGLSKDEVIVKKLQKFTRTSKNHPLTGSAPLARLPIPVKPYTLNTTINPGTAGMPSPPIATNRAFLPCFSGI